MWKKMLAWKMAMGTKTKTKIELYAMMNKSYHIYNEVGWCLCWRWTCQAFTPLCGRFSISISGIHWGLESQVNWRLFILQGQLGIEYGMITDYVIDPLDARVGMSQWDTHRWPAYNPRRSIKKRPTSGIEREHWCEQEQCQHIDCVKFVELLGTTLNAPSSVISHLDFDHVSVLFSPFGS